MTARRSDGAPLLLSDRAAAKALGIRRAVVAELRRTRLLRSVPWFKGHRIPLAEVERLAMEGVPELGQRPARRQRPAAGSLDIRSIDVEAL